MKKLLLLGLAIITLASCGDENDAPKKDYLVLSGKVNNFRKKSIDLKGFGYERKLEFNRKTKKFSDTIRDIKPGHYRLIAGKRVVNIYLDSTRDLSIKVDAKKRTKRPIFKGDSVLVKINKYLLSKVRKHEVILGNANKLFGYNEKTFLKKMKKYKSSVKKLAKKVGLPKEYLDKELRNINYEYARNLNNYEKYYRILTGNEDYNASEKLNKELTKIDPNNADDYVFSFSYRKFLHEYLENVSISSLKQNTVEGDEQEEDVDLDLTYIDIVNTGVENQFIKNELLYNVAKNNITFTSDLPTFYKKIMEYSDSEEHNKEITELYDKLKLTAKGEPSPTFKDYENFEGGKTSLDDLLGKGKYIYIDVWATWCGFCKKEIPLLKNFEEKYHGKNVDFVSINVDTKDKYDIWKKTIKDKEMGGVQLFSGKAFKDLEFAQKYLIVGLPRFILLDPEGKIISSNAPRPSEGYKLDEMFEKYGIGEAH